MRKIMRIERMMFNVLADSTYQCEYWTRYRALADPETKKEITRKLWPSLKGETVEDKIFAAMKQGYLLKMVPDEDEPAYVSYDKLADVVRKNYRALDEDEWDSDSAMQTACFGEVVYG